MPTATSTMTVTMPKEPSASKTLGSLYHRAAKAFLKRNVTQTHSLIQSAFDILDSNYDSLKTNLDLQHSLRKWDILRVTLETTVYSSPPSASDFPEQLKQISLKTPHALVKDMYSRSLMSFSFSKDRTPAATAAVLLPFQVVSVLVYSSVKVDAPQIGREIIEEWLGRRVNSLAYFPRVPSDGAGDGYEKVLELYCLQVLPRLEEWEYATEFLQYESELTPEARSNLHHSLRTQYVQAMSGRIPSPSSLEPSTSASSVNSRSQSPTPSSSSSSSSLSTTSTHTIVPSTPRRGLASFTPSSASSASSEGTITPTGNGHLPNGALSHPIGNGHATPQHRRDKGKGKARSPVVSGSGSLAGSVPSSPPRHSHSPSNHPLNPHSSNPLSLPRSHLNRSVGRNGSGDGRMTTYALIRASLEPYWSKLSNLGGSRITALVFMVVLPIASIIMRWRGRRSGTTGVNLSPSNAEVVRRRLRTVNVGNNQVKVLGMMLVKMWWSFVQAVLDTVRMGISGLV